jgi:hypothetical protein
LGTQLPKGAKDGFQVLVNLSTKTFSLPWRPGQPIKAIRAKEIVLADQHVEQGLDGNPMDTEIRFDVPSGKLSYRNSYAALFPVNENFTADCKVVPNI